MFGELFQKLTKAQTEAAQARLRRWGVDQDLLGVTDPPARRGADSHTRRQGASEARARRRRRSAGGV